MHEYFQNDATQNSVMAHHLWNLDFAEHRCLYALYAFKRIFNANSCSGNYQINTNVTGIVPDKKTQLNGWVLLILLKQLLSEACLQRR
jgi:hypothetical protein